ncbi:MAG: anti-anti-sigma factor [Candidatus Dactylopiibacterium carminicum]|uniref:Anti-sigma factor antagonist n=1 Tax=Candidatus Dactylopiibacterium carminicum TaxID=857335 RepID=A0A272ERQ8_9RHOO|nr:STAS domain-containing protein [Candidatus Dactylopiibacterium carminicum]KAF7598902.1 anti-sigma factor antagonist [Candidatus Dactylopiibacterium carminicum]PAS92799.1 MAG: anti-anti-sigma factor [Candidatus Dactylopiibacterium carminicum]PAS98920.1 MAG: anti-anti-sigma factor [Candidatus Dactylopiibacterium carminicum]
MDAQVSINDSQAVLRLGSRFDFKAHREFRDAVESLLGQAGSRNLQVDLAEVTYLDSSALGMLLMLRDKAKATNKDVALVGVKGSVKQVLDIANFSKLFSIA